MTTTPTAPGAACTNHAAPERVPERAVMTAPATEPTPSPCLTCPWRTTNHGTPHPDGWYTKANRQRLWAKLRRGESMSCHNTDPTNPVSDKALAAGVKPAPEHAQARECVGALILQQREVMAFQVYGHLRSAFKVYAKANPRGLTKGGLAHIIQRHLLAGTPLTGPRMPKPDLNAPVSHDPLHWPPKAGTGV